MAQPWGLIIILFMRKCQRPEPAAALLVISGFFLRKPRGNLRKRKELSKDFVRYVSLYLEALSCIMTAEIHFT